MVKVTPIQEDEAAAFFENESKSAAAAAANDEYSDVESSSDDDNEKQTASNEDEEDEYDEDDEYDIANETIGDRIIALKDAIPPTYRYKLAATGSTAAALVQATVSFTGKSLWIITTSSLLLGVPLALSIIGEQQLIEMEREMKMTQSTNEVLAPGAGSGFQQPAGAV